MKTILNVIWLLLCGLWMAIGYVVAGIICCILIITIPFGIASFRMANYALWPFGRTVVRKPTAGAASMIGNIIWLIVAGIWLALGHIATGLALWHHHHRHSPLASPASRWCRCRCCPPLGAEIVPPPTSRCPAARRPGSDTSTRGRRGVSDPSDEGVGSEDRA